MLPLSQSEIFGSSDRTLDIKKTLDKLNAGDYLVDPALYEHYLHIFKGYKYPLAKVVSDSAKRGILKLILFADPTNPRKDKILNIPVALFSFMLNIDGKLVSVADISPRAGYLRNKMDDTKIDFLKIAERDLYAYLQSAFTNYVIKMNESALMFSPKFIKTVSEIYSTLMAKCIDKTYPIGADRDNYIILTYLSALFFNQYVLGLDAEKASQYAMSIRTVSKPAILQSSAYNRNVTMKSVDEFLAVLETEFSFIRKGAMKYRNLMNQYLKMYGQNALYAIENVFSFINMLQMASMRNGLFQDAIIDSLSANYVKDIDTLLLEAFESHNG